MATRIDASKAAALRLTLTTLRQQIQEVMPPKGDDALEREPFSTLVELSFYAEEATYYLDHDQQRHDEPAPSPEPSQAWINPST